MSEEITFESLNLQKPLEKMTAKELRQMVMEKIPQITGASGMSKEELLSNIKEFFDLTDEEGKASPYQEQITATKRQIRELRAQKQDMTDASRKERDKMRKKIKRLKRRTRRMSETK